MKVDPDEPEVGLEAGCKACGQPEVEAGYALGLCAERRARMVHRPLPGWLLWCLAPVLLAASIS